MAQACQVSIEGRKGRDHGRAVAVYLTGRQPENRRTSVKTAAVLLAAVLEKCSGIPVRQDSYLRKKDCELRPYALSAANKIIGGIPFTPAGLVSSLTRANGARESGPKKLFPPLRVVVLGLRVIT